MAYLTDLQLKKLGPCAKPIADGAIPGLRFEPGSINGEGKWTLRFVSPTTGKRRDMGLGVYPEVSIADARARGMDARRRIAGGVDPIDDRRAALDARKAVDKVLTFEQAALQVHLELKAGWKNAEHVDQWINTLRDYAFPKVGRVKVADLTPKNVADLLRPIWLAKPETALRVKQRCHKVLAWCWAHGLITANPVDVVGHLLPQQNGLRERIKHQPAMPWSDIPAFVRDRVRDQPPNVTRALLEFVILTAARSGEARAMTWGEIDWNAKVWTVPSSRMKTKVTHRIPLPERAVEILTAQRARRTNDFVFQSPRGAILSDMVLTAYLRDCGAQSNERDRTATAHGFRSSFRDWASENGYARDLAERALSHTIKNHVEAAYHRTDLLEQRRAMMEAWARHVSDERSATVVPLRGRA